MLGEVIILKDQKIETPRGAQQGSVSNPITKVPVAFRSKIGHFDLIKLSTRQWPKADRQVAK